MDQEHYERDVGDRFHEELLATVTRVSEEVSMHRTQTVCFASEDPVYSVLEKGRAAARLNQGRGGIAPGYVDYLANNIYDGDSFLETLMLYGTPGVDKAEVLDLLDNSTVEIQNRTSRAPGCLLGAP